MPPTRSLNVLIAADERPLKKATKEGVDDLGKLEKASEKAGASLVKHVGESGHKVGGMLKKGLAPLAGIAAAAGVASGLSLSSAIAEALDIKEANAKLKAQLGLNAKESARLGKIAGEVYAKNYGDSLGEVNEALKNVITNIDGMADVSNARLKGMTGDVISVAKAFDQDLGGVTRAIGQMLRTDLAPNAQQALNIITRGFQGGADKSQDFLDTLNEYGTQFRKLGIDGETATGLIVQGLKNGARDADIVADSIKEFSIRALDGSETTKKGFEALGLDAERMARRIGRGGDTAREALDNVLDRLRNVEDPVERSRVAVELFGTQAEDLGDALNALDPSSAVREIGKVEGAARDVNRTMGDNPKAKLQEYWRALKKAASDALDDVTPKIEKFVDEMREGRGAGGRFADAVRDVKPALKDQHDATQDVIDALKPYVDATKDAYDWTKRHKTIMGLLGASIQTPADNLKMIAGILDGVAGAARGVKAAIEKMIDSFDITPGGGLFKALGIMGDGLGKAGDGIGNIAAFGGGLMGADPELAPVAGAASRFGLNVTSGLRPGAITSSGNKSYHSTGEALDVSGTPAGMKGFFNFMKNTMGPGLAELIYTPGGAGIRNGRSHTYSGQVAKDHFDHVHVAVDTGVPGVGDGIGQIRDLWTRAGGRASVADIAAAIAMAESGGNPAASNRNTDGSVDRGLWQINSVHGRLSTFDRLANARAAVSISGNGRNWNPWTVYRTGAYRKFLTSGGSKGGGSKSREAPRGAQSDYDPEAMYGGLPTDRFGREIPVLGTAPGALKGLPEGFEPPEPGPTQADYLGSAVARARLTPGTEDDAYALGNLLQLRKAEMDAALADSDPRNDEDAINAYLAVEDALKQLTDATNESNRLQQQRDAQNAEIIANQGKILALAQQGPQIVAAVVAAVSGGIGGQLGIAFQTPGYAGGVANYAGGGTGRL